MLDLSRLSPEQRQAVLAGDGPLLIVAGPGSGKTTVLAGRIAYLVAFRQVAPATVLAITFATKAARELRARLRGLLGDGGEAVDVSTFHAFGLRIVRQWSEELGLGPGPVSVYGDSEVRAVLREAAHQLGLDRERQPTAELVANLERYRMGKGNVATSDSVGQLARAYEDILRRRGAVDFAAMLTLPLRLFDARPATLGFYQTAYRYVLVDEFQDICASQYALLRRLAEGHRNVVVVGDPRQSLYGWRGLQFAFLRDFQRDFPEARLLHLSQNFRSTGRIVDVANALGGSIAEGDPLWTDNPPGHSALLYAAQDERAEAEFVASEIEHLRAQASVAHPGEVAVLYRTNQQAHAVALALRERAIPYRVLGTGDLFARREVRDAIAYLRLAHNPGDAPALARIVNVPPRRLGRVAQTLRSHPVPLGDLVALTGRFGAPATEAARQLVGLIDEIRRQSATQGVPALLDVALEGSGYPSWLAGLPGGSRRMASLGALREVATRVVVDLGSWLAELQANETADAARADEKRVLLTTIHGAKGGEWRVVFVIGVEEGLLPHHRAANTGPVDASVAEELRVAYVAVTRPRERLYLTYCSARRRGEHTERRWPSRFLNGLPVDYFGRAA